MSVGNTLLELAWGGEPHMLLLLTLLCLPVKEPRPSLLSARQTQISHISTEGGDGDGLGSQFIPALASFKWCLVPDLKTTRRGILVLASDYKLNFYPLDACSPRGAEVGEFAGLQAPVLQCLLFRRCCPSCLKCTKWALLGTSSSLLCLHNGSTWGNRTRGGGPQAVEVVLVPGSHGWEPLLKFYVDILSKPQKSCKDKNCM